MFYVFPGLCAIFGATSLDPSPSFVRQPNAESSSCGREFREGPGWTWDLCKRLDSRSRRFASGEKALCFDGPCISASGKIKVPPLAMVL